MAVNVFIMVLFIGSPLCGYAQMAEQLLGKWKDSKHPEKQIVMFRQSATTFCGEKIAAPGKANEKKTVLFRNLTWDSSTRTYKGVLIDPERQNEYGIILQMPAKDRFTFTVKRFFLSRTFQFVRIE